jgi:hypothetical protein
MERAMGIEPTSEAWEASILPLYDARSFLQLVDYTQRRNCSYRLAIPHIFQIHSGKRPHALPGQHGLYVKALAQAASSGRGNCEQARNSRSEMIIVADSFQPHPPRMVKTGQQASLAIL